jgi:hypothetical protein
LGNYLTSYFSFANILKFDYDPVRNCLHMEAAFEEGGEVSTMLLEGIFKTEIFAERLLGDVPMAREISDIGTIHHTRYPKGHPNPPHVFFTIGMTKYRFWCRKVIVNGTEEFELSKLIIFDTELEELGLPEDWTPPTENLKGEYS